MKYHKRNIFRPLKIKAIKHRALNFIEWPPKANSRPSSISYIKRDAATREGTKREGKAETPRISVSPRVRGSFLVSSRLRAWARHNNLSPLSLEIRNVIRHTNPSIHRVVFESRGGVGAFAQTREAALTFTGNIGCRTIDRCSPSSRGATPQISHKSTTGDTRKSAVMGIGRM